MTMMTPVGLGPNCCLMSDDHAPVPYMSPQLLDAIRLRNKVKKIFSKTNDPSDGEKYRTQLI